MYIIANQQGLRIQLENHLRTYRFQLNSHVFEKENLK